MTPALAPSTLHRHAALEKLLVVALQIVHEGGEVLPIIAKVSQFIVGQALLFQTTIEIFLIVFHGIDEEANGLLGKVPWSRSSALTYRVKPPMQSSGPAAPSPGRAVAAHGPPVAIAIVRSNIP
jgi:hypothetical protein